MSIEQQDLEELFMADYLGVDMKPEDRLKVGDEVKLSRGYFRLAGNQSVFTIGKKYEVIGFDGWRVAIKDDNQTERSVNERYCKVA